METSSRSSALVGLCATGGAVAVLTSAGLVPAIGLAFGLGGGWLLGQKLKSKTQKPQVKAQPQPVEDEDGTDEEQEEAIQELGEFMGAEVLGRFLGRLQEQDPSNGQLDGPEVKLIQDGLHQAFDQMPRERLAQLLMFFMPRPGKPPSFEEFSEFQQLCEELQQLMPQEARECMERTNGNFLQHVLHTMPGSQIKAPQSEAQLAPS
mmetsp:Transcript_68393/g.107474  ORF Transcript_68393/g.107474 Transcript_68393/m.107474 type:complete len:206 (+) Transcript_68393:35-652(+)